jgi:hypothetical protein
MERSVGKNEYRELMNYADYIYDELEILEKLNYMVLLSEWSKESDCESECFTHTSGVRISYNAKNFLNTSAHLAWLAGSNPVFIGLTIS